ncbi:MAG: toxic anion resistance protein, partial [Betaproteobacteria bacterium]|nr:toxic anion resistance protein [Betaproteobacteria bacterium]
MNQSTSNPVATEQALSPTQNFTLEPPQPVAAVPPESASGRVRLKAEDIAALDAQVRQFIDDITAHDSQSPQFKDAVSRIHAMGNKDI